MVTTQLLGTDELTENGRETVETTTNDYLSKYDRFLKEITSLKLHVKVHNKGGTRKQYDISLRVESPSGFFESHHTEWQLNQALKHVFDAVLHEIKHKLRV